MRALTLLCALALGQQQEHRTDGECTSRMIEQIDDAEAKVAVLLDALARVPVDAQAEQAAGGDTGAGTAADTDADVERLTAPLVVGENTDTDTDATPSEGSEDAPPVESPKDP